MSVHCNGDESYFCVSEIEIFMFIAQIYYLCLESGSKNFNNDKIIQNSFNGTMYEFSTDYDLIGK